MMCGSTSKLLSLACAQFVGVCWMTRTVHLHPAKMAEKCPRFGELWAGMAKLGAGVDNELGGSAPHQCR